MPLFYVFSRAAGSPVCNAARRSHAFPQVRCGYSGRGVTEDGREVPLGGVSARCEDSVSRPPRKQGCLRYVGRRHFVVREGGGGAGMGVNSVQKGVPEALTSKTYCSPLTPPESWTSPSSLAEVV